MKNFKKKLRPKSFIIGIEENEMNFILYRKDRQIRKRVNIIEYYVLTNNYLTIDGKAV